MDSPLQRVLAEKYAGNAPPLQAATPTVRRARASPVLSSQQQITRALKELPKGRTSRVPSDGNGAWWTLATYENRDRLDTIASCRRLCIEDADAGGALADLVALAIPPLPDGSPGIRVEFEGSQSAISRAEREIDALIERLHLPLHELAANGMREVYQGGGFGAEWYPNPGRTGVLGMEIVPAEELIPRRRDNERFWQQINNPTPLSPQTFCYTSYGTRGRDEFGTPAMIAALRELERKANITLGIDKVIRLLAQGVFLTVGIPTKSPQDLNFEDENDPGYAEALAAHYEAYVQMAATARDLGIGAFEDGTEMKAVPLTGNVGGLSDLEEMNALKVWSGLLTLPFMRGKMDSTTQALAQVVYPILLAHAMGLRQAVTRTIEFGLNLHLRLAGVPARAILAFQEPPNPFRKDHAAAALSQVEVDERYTALYGEEYVRWAAERDGFDADKVVAAWKKRQAQPALPPPQPNPNPPQGGEPNAPTENDPEP
ncbi:hypothetical protein [Deinococcus hopiensis]|uniref:Phage portal protein, lambda family n=1 Tax=Deinococcus hopiensis KR-140 TaxID=695939 RepID=A0A1W1V7C7_9DEIO|nr:hypothetical protein [Deinococcus hopiensis]SMB89183.1 hypothetical protein SAMN00790413_00297 [Deinococcus hopiensis KR-140]